jgi:hypothetical protein
MVLGGNSRSTIIVRIDSFCSGGSGTTDPGGFPMGSKITGPPFFVGFHFLVV